MVVLDNISEYWEEAFQALICGGGQGDWRRREAAGVTWALRPLRKFLVEDLSARTEPLPKNDLLGAQTLIDWALKEKESSDSNGGEGQRKSI